MTGRGPRDEKEVFTEESVLSRSLCPRLLRFVIKSAEGREGMNTC